MFSIYKKELHSFFNSLIAYLVIGIFLLATGLYIWVVPEYNIFDNGFADLQILFDSAPYLLMFLIPAITMRSIAEEIKMGTLELLLTKPISEFEIVIGKYLASLSIVLFAIAPTFVYFYSIYQLANPIGNIDSAGIVGSYFGIILLGAIFTSCGIFASTLGDNQITSFIYAIILCFFFFNGFSTISTFGLFANYQGFINKLGIGYHYETLSKGLIDLRDIFYFIASISIMLYASVLTLKSRNWN